MGKLRLRETYLEKDLVLADAGTLVTDINVVDPIMDLFIKFYATNGATYNRRNYIFDVVSNIEVVDGSDVLFGLKPKECLAMNAYHYKESLHWGINEIADKEQHCTFKIPWGLGRYDPTIAFDPTQFKNPQLRITWNLAALQAVGAEGFLSGSGRVDVIATIAERYPTRPAGFLMHKHIHEWVTPSAASRRIEMPVDYTHRTVFLRVDEDAIATAPNPCRDPWNVIDEALYNVDEKKYIPFEWDTDDWMYWLKEFYGMWHQGMDFNWSQGTGLCRHVFLPANQALACTPKESTTDPEFWSQLTGNYVYFKRATALAAEKKHVKADGTMPFSTWAYPFGDPEDMEEWLEVRDIGHIRFEIHHATNSEKHIGQIFLTQYRPY